MIDNDLIYGTLAGWPPVQPVSSVAPNNSAIEDSDYVGSLVKTSSSASCTRPIVFGTYQHANPGWRRRWKLPAVKEAIIHLNNLDHITTGFQGGALVLVNGSIYKEFLIPAVAGLHYVKLGFPTAVERDVELVMPYSASIAHVGLTVNGSVVAPSSLRGGLPRAAFIGDSRVQGFSATGIAKTWPYLLCAAKGWQQINLGFGSSGITSSWGTDLGNADPDIVISMTDYNNRTAQTPLATFKQAYKDLITNFRVIKPTTKFYLVQSTWISAANDALTLKMADYRTTEAEALTELANSNNILVNGLDLTTVDDTTRFPDGIHPNDLASSEMATALAAIVSI